MSALFKLKQGALLPEVELTLTPTGFTYDLSQATAREFRYRLKGGSEPLETIALTVVDAPTKKVKLTPTAQLVDLKGKFECHVKLTMPGAKDLYFPQTGFDSFEITDNF